MFVIGYCYELRPRRHPQVGIRVLHQRIPRDVRQSGDVVLWDGQWKRLETYPRAQIKVQIRMGMNPGCTVQAQNAPRLSGGSEPGHSMYWFLRSGFPEDRYANNIVWVNVAPFWSLMRTEAILYLNKTCRNTITEDDVFIRYKDRYELERAVY